MNSDDRSPIKHRKLATTEQPYRHRDSEEGSDSADEHKSHNRSKVKQKPKTVFLFRLVVVVCGLLLAAYFFYYRFFKQQQQQRQQQQITNEQTKGGKVRLSKESLREQIENARQKKRKEIVSEKEKLLQDLNLQLDDDDLAVENESPEDDQDDDDHGSQEEILRERDDDDGVENKVAEQEGMADPEI